MRRIKEVLRLRFGLGWHQDQIARSCGIAQATVHRYLERARAACLGWPVPEGCDDERIATASFERTARVWSASTGHELSSLRGHQDAVWSVAWSPDAKRIATASSDNTVR